MNSPTSRIAATALWWAWMPALAYLYWLVVHVLFGGVGTWDQWWRLDVVHRAWLPDGLNIWHATALFWIWVVVGLLGTAAIHSGVLSELADESFDGSSAEVAVGGAIAVVAVVVLAWQVPSALWDNDKVQGRYYNAATTFHITSMTNPPASTTYLVGGARKSSGLCDWRGDHDVPSCIKTGPLTGIQHWEGRTSSYASALTMMQHAASPAPNVNVWDSTLTYLYGQPGADGVWTAVLDGSGKTTPLYGVAVWDGKTNSVKVGCHYTPGAADRAFHGQRGNSLPNWLAEKFPNLRYNESDVWGYCDGTKPVIVVPAQKQINVGDRTVMTAAGVIVVTAAGGIQATYRPTVNIGELPGPAYPVSLVELQRDQVQWAAGRKWKQRANFGYQPTVSDVQGSNVSENLLRGPDHRLYYVTPLTPNSSTSQAFIAYSVTPADTVTSGHLNPLDVYVLPDGDQNIANLNALTNSATDAVRSLDATFLNTGGGKLEEFTPLGADMWRVYGVRRGQTEFYIDLSATGRTQPRTVNVSAATPQPQPPTVAGGPPTGPTAGAVCGKPPAKMSAAEQSACLKAIAEQIQAHGGGK